MTPGAGELKGRVSFFAKGAGDLDAASLQCRGDGGEDGARMIQRGVAAIMGQGH